MPYNNTFIHAAAGAGKTTRIARYAINSSNSKVLLTTYTNMNTQNLYDTVCKLNGCQTENLTIMSWYSFLLHEGVRPYQNYIYPYNRIENLTFVQGKSTQGIAKSDIRHYFMSDKSHIYNDKMSEFAFQSNEVSNGLVIKRLEEMYDIIIIDEAQDISGYDFDFIELLIHSNIKIVMVADIRQKTYSTTQSTKNKRYTNNILQWFEYLNKKSWGELRHWTFSYRCIQEICDFSDNLFPKLPKTQSKNIEQSNHDGLFYISADDLLEYCSMFQPQILINDKRARYKAKGLATLNFGLVKGQTFERVVIIPTDGIEKYISTGKIEHVDKSLAKAKFYVAITRARQSVTFVTDKTNIISGIEKWVPK